jgi:hypothetical protein
MEEEALDRTVCSTRFGKRYGPVVKQSKGWMSIASTPSPLIMYTQQNIRRYRRLNHSRVNKASIDLSIREM